MTTVPFIDAALGPSGIDWRSREIVIVRTSAQAGGHYCVAAHTVVLDAVLDRGEVTALRGDCRPRRCSPSAAQPTLLRWVDTVGAAAGAVDDGAPDGVLAHWADHEVVELTAVVGVVLLAQPLRHRSGVTHLQRHPRPGSPGKHCCDHPGNPARRGYSDPQHARARERHNQLREVPRHGLHRHRSDHRFGYRIRACLTSPIRARPQASR